MSVPESEEVHRVLEAFLPRTSIEYVDPHAAGPWPHVVAWLVGSIDRELPAWTFDRTPRLRFVQRLFTGLDDFPFDRFPESVRIAGNVGAYAPFVAEHAVALLLAVTHNVIANWEKVRAGQLRPPVSNRYLAGRTVLILGYGEIGRAVARLSRPFGPTVEAVTRSGRSEPTLARTYPADRLADALGSADAVVECRPLTDATRGSLDGSMLARMRRGAILVNVGRAATVNPAALFARLTAEPEFRAAFDVWWEEDFEGGSIRHPFPFGTLPNFLGSPHVAGIGAEPRSRSFRMAAENLHRFFSGETPRHLADRGEYRRSQ